MISGFDAAAKDVALENGADVYLEKPFTKAQIYKAIETLTKSKLINLAINSLKRKCSNRPSGPFLFACFSNSRNFFSKRALIMRLGF